MEVNGLNIQNGHKMLIQPMQVIHGLTFRKKKKMGVGEGGWPSTQIERICFLQKKINEKPI